MLTTADRLVLFTSSLMLPKYLPLRAWYQRYNWAICGLTATLSSSFELMSCLALGAAAVAPHDAIICSTVAARKTMRRDLRRADAQRVDPAGRAGDARGDVPGDSHGRQRAGGGDRRPRGAASRAGPAGRCGGVSVPGPALDRQQAGFQTAAFDVSERPRTAGQQRARARRRRYPVSSARAPGGLHPRVSRTPSSGDSEAQRHHGGEGGAVTERRRVRRLERHVRGDVLGSPWSRR